MEINLEKIKEIICYDTYDEISLEEGCKIEVEKGSEYVYGKLKEYIKVTIEEKDDNETEVMNLLVVKLYDDFKNLEVAGESEMGHSITTKKDDKKIFIGMCYLPYSILFEKSLGKTIHVNILYMSRKRIYRKMIIFNSI